MRALLDANVFLSFLLSSDALASATGVILDAAANGRFTLLFSPGVADEVKAKVRERPDLARKITLAEADRLLANIADLALVITPGIDSIPEIGRDRKDDYLIADAVVAGADFLVTWDKDLLDLEMVEDVRIVMPGEMVPILREWGDLAQ